MIVEASPGLAQHGKLKTCGVCGEQGHNSRRHRTDLVSPAAERSRARLLKERLALIKTDPPVLRITPEEATAFLASRPKVVPFNAQKRKVRALWLRKQMRFVCAKDAQGVWHEKVRIFRDPVEGPVLLFPGGREPLLQEGQGSTWASAFLHTKGMGCPCPGCVERREKKDRVRADRDAQPLVRRTRSFTPKIGPGAVDDDGPITFEKRNPNPTTKADGILSPRDLLVCTRCEIRGHLVGDPDLCIQRAEDYARQQSSGTITADDAA